MAPCFRTEATTDHASRCLQQLCKHWSHRFTVEFDAARGVVDFGDARCRFEAEPRLLRLTLTDA